MPEENKNIEENENNIQNNEISESSANASPEPSIEEQPENDLLDAYYSKTIKAIKEVEKKAEFAGYYYDICNSGENRFYQKNITETKYFDEEWIKTMEAFFPSIDRIIRNPKMSIRYDEEVVNIEKAKKINSASVRHLASHSSLIRDVKDGVVTPKKILTTFAEEEIGTYENRFIKTLIERLFIFVRNRYVIIKDNVESFQNDHLYYTSNFNMKDENVDLKIDLNIKRDLDNEAINKHNIELLQRTQRLMTLISGYKASPFMIALKKAKNVTPPIMKTNVILKNADFKNAYTLWLFLDRFNSLGYDINVRERPVRLSSEFRNNLDRISALTYAAFINNKKNRKVDFTKIELVEPIVKKSTKQVKTNAADAVKRPDELMLNDNTINEYYLELNKKAINQKLKDQVDEDIKIEAKSKKIIKEAISITNAIFDSFFNLEENIDYFQQFVTEEDPAKSYEEAKTKVRIAKIIREAKEVDYKRAIRLEKNLYKVMLQTNNQRLRKANSQKKDEAYAGVLKQIEKDIANFKKEKERVNAQILKLEGKIESIETGKTDLEQEKDQIKLALIEEFKNNAREEKLAFNKEMAKLQAKHDEKMKKLAADLQANLEKAKANKAKRLAQNKQKVKDLSLKNKQELQAKNQKELDKQKEKYQKQEEEQKEKNQNKIDKANN